MSALEAITSPRTWQEWRPLARVRSRLHASETRHQFWGYAFLAPILVVLVGFKFIPMLQALALSFTSYDLLSAPRFVGLNNYVALVQDPLFRQSVGTTLYYIVGTCVPVWILALGLAVFFNTALPAKPLLRVMYFFPTIMPPVVFAVVWRFMYHPYGLMNVGLGSLGLPAVNWLTDSAAAMPAIILASEWRFIPHFLILYLAGLQNIPTEYHEAAAIDGASAWHRFRTITMPLLKPTFLLVIVTSIITASQVFTAAFVLTEGGPNGATNVLSLFIYQNGFLYFKMGRAAAVSMLLLLGLLAVTLVQLRLFREDREG